MDALAHRIKALLLADDGVTVSEYGAMLALIIIACIAVITSLGEGMVSLFNTLCDEVSIL